ncbi:P-loop NTPase [archaeon]|jgi:MinD superfamily P-loop ATPase|nr:P-loop NTPase [archaeon]MBT4647904.1 P-loop NTPase [archaeon]MBT7393138.1 P-loop NTPase [archaeon]
MKKITILSGKGGVGKSSITASLAVTMSKKHKIICVDCDVDASNLALIFGLRDIDYDSWKPISTNQKAYFDLEKCNSCGKCYRTCYFDAIKFENNKPELKQFSCEGCGACELVCAKDAITLVNVDNAKIGYAKTKYDFKVVSAQLGIGESGSGKVVSAVKELGDKLSENSDFMLIDAAAGIGCPVIASVTGSDYVIAITEPTPSGFSDLKRALKMVNHFKIPKSVIINKYDINLDFSKKIEKYLIENNLKLTSKIKYDKSFSDALMNLVPVIEQNEEFLNVFQKIYVDLSKEIF